jgi:hypothetical protein
LRFGGGQLLRFAGSIPSDGLQLMREAIEQDCERIDFDECRFLLNISIVIALFADEAIVKCQRQSCSSP